MKIHLLCAIRVLVHSDHGELRDIARLHQQYFPLGPPLGAAPRTSPTPARLVVSAGPCPRLHPHLLLLIQLVSSYAATGHLADAPRAFRAHLAIANLRTYAVLVSALARSRPASRSRSSSTCCGVPRPPPHLHRPHHLCRPPTPLGLLGPRAPPRPCLYTRLIDAYTKGRDMAASRKVFDGMLCPGGASRNALLISYAKNKMYLKALSVFREVAGQG